MQEVHVVTPVFRGGQLRHNALDSLAACRNPFNEVIISFDGPRRAEYFIATQPLIKNLLGWKSPVVGVVQHLSQENLQTPLDLARKDEAPYYLWLSITSQHLRIQDRAIALEQCVRKLIHSLPRPPKWLYSGMAFWRTCNDTPH